MDAADHRHLTIPLALITLVSTTGTALAPVLGRRPLVPAMVSPMLGFLVLAADSSPALAFVALGTLRSCLAGRFNYLLGRRLSGGGSAATGRRAAS